MKKRILAILLCIFSVFALAGCGSVNYSITISDDGSVTMAVNLVLNTKDITDSGKNFFDFQLNVQSVANQVVANSFASFEQEVNDIAVDGVVETYTGDMTVSQVIAYVESNVEPINQKAKIEWVQKNNQTYCVISLKFKTIYAYRYFNGTFPSTENKEEEGSETVLKDKFFFAEEWEISNAPFNDISNNQIAKYFVQYFNDYFTVDDMEYSFSYSTPSTKLYSDATSVSTDASTGNTVHTWKFSVNDLKENGKSKIATYTVKIRAWVWYVLAIILSIAVGIVMLVIVKSKGKKLKKNEENIIQKFNETAKEIREHDLAGESLVENEENKEEAKDN